MHQMKGKIKDEHQGSSAAISDAISVLGNKLNKIGQYMKSKLNYLLPRSLPTEAALCLLICSIFPDGCRIAVDDLATFGMGLGCFDDVHLLSEVRCRVHDLINIINDFKYPPKVTGIKIRLADEEDRIDHNYVKMLVGAHDLAKTIAASYPSVFHRETVIEKWPDSSRYKDCYGVSLLLKKVKEHHANMECPELALLQLQCGEDSQTIPISFFEGMKQLRVLSLDMPLLPQAVDVLRNLRTLRLKLIKSDGMSLIGSLSNLEFLSISILSLTDIPREMGQLENLRVLDIGGMNIHYFPPSVLSRLLKLEELYLPLSFKSWGRKAKEIDDEWDLGEEDNFDDEERINSSLSEIKSPSLKALQVSVPIASVLPKKSPVFKSIQEFKILQRNKLCNQLLERDSVNELQLTGEACDIEESGICDLMSRTEVLSLTRVRYLKNVIYQLEDNGFPRLKKMIIAECDEMEYVVDTTKKQNLSEDDCLFQKLECLHLSMLSNLRGICNGRLTNFRLFPNLSHVSMRFCHKIKYVFPLSVVKGSMIKSIEVLDCKEMKGIFNEDTEEEITPKHFSAIEKLELYSLPKLFSLLVNGVQDSTDHLLTTHTLVSSSNSSRMDESCINNEELICLPPNSTGREKLQKGVIIHNDTCEQVSLVKEDLINPMETGIFPPKLAEKWLQNMKRLKIAFCDAVKVIFLFEENHSAPRAFSSLKELELHGLPNLVHIWHHIPPKMTNFQNLQLLVLSECNNSYLLSRPVANMLVQLEKLCVCRCKKMEQIILKDGNDVNGKLVFPRLQLLELQRLPNLSVFSRGIYEIGLPVLKSVKFDECNKMKYFSNGVLRMPMLHRVEINGSLCLLRGNLNATMMWLFRQYSYADLEDATMGWILGNLLGTGDFGEVFMGHFGEGTFWPTSRDQGLTIAIKRFNLKIQQWLGEWQLEIELLKTLYHPNLIKFFGHCWEGEELFLVCEYMWRSSLDIHLFRNNRASECLSWDMRIKIAIDAAQGLDFLHSKKVVHSNVKSSNILLDLNYTAKLADYGLTISWWLMDECTNADMEICGYAAPESFEGHLQAKSDVYSFGVVLLEMMTGLKALDKNRATALVDMVSGLKPIHKKTRKLQKIMDVRIRSQYSQTAMLLAAELALNCIEYNPENRPTMNEVVAILEQIHEKEYEPKPKGLELCTVSP